MTRTAIRRAKRFAKELKRRQVFTVATVYVVVAGGVWQGASLAFPALGLPGWSVTLVIVLTIVGFPLALVLGWAYDLSPRGVVKTRSLGRTAAAAVESTSIGSEGEVPDRETGARWERVERHFTNVIERPPEARTPYLDRRADEDPEVASEVETLLVAHESAGPLDSLADWIGKRASVPELRPGTRIAQYRLGERLGGGGMGVVYEAVDERLERRVALKFLAPAISADPRARKRFLVEARAASALDHPNVCTILEVGEAPGDRVFLAMPFYEGQTLRARIERGPLEPDRALEIAREIARGLGAAHRHGIIHRDLKPANVMLTSEGVAKIVDFGVAKVAGASLTSTGTVLGTVSYMSPEQARGEEIDHRSDLWSLGCVLFEMLTGQRPFTGTEEVAVRRAILSGPSPSLDGWLPDLADSVGPLLGRVLCREPEGRYASAAELVADIDTLLEAEPVAGTLESGGSVLAPGERRICTVVTTRLTPHDRLVEELGPDELRSVSRRIDMAVSEAVTSEGGVVIGKSGSRCEAAFGVPATHEDDARRALRCSVTIRDRVREIGDQVTSGLDVELTCRIGVDTGHVVVRRGEDSTGYEVSGRTVRVARELARRAPDGGILVTSECRRLVIRGFETEAMEDVEVTGEEGPVGVHRIVGVRSGADAFGADVGSRLTDFRGRDQELSELLRLASGAESEGGGLVQVVGEPGVGKSRLVYEFTRSLEESGFRVLTGRCLPVSRGTSYAPVEEILRQVLAGEGATEAELDPDAVVDGLLEMEEGLRASIPLLLRLLSLSHPDHPFPAHVEGDEVRVAVAESVAGLFSVLAETEPLVLVFEDWHWADAASTSVLRQLAALAPALKLLLVVTLRSGYGVDLHDFPGASTITLDPLGTDSSAALLSAVLEADAVQEGLARVIAAKTGGNPFYIEECGADLVEQEVVAVEDGVARLTEGAEVRLPDSVQAVIRARVDRVDPWARSVLFAASVIGREFSYALLREITDGQAGLDRPVELLKSGGLIQQFRVLPEPAYRFKHALTRDVIYESLLSHRRRQLHRRTAEALETRAGPGEAPAELLAHHFARARAWREAMPYGIEAARRSVELSENADALSLLDRVTDEWASHVEPSETSTRLLKEALFMKERVLDAMGRRQAQQEVIDRLAELVGDGDDETLRIEVELRQGDLFASIRRHDDAVEVLEHALESSRAAGDPETQRKALRSLGMVWWHREEGTEGKALGLLEEALALDVACGDRSGELADRMNICHVLLAMGVHEKALAAAEELADLADRSDVMAGVNATYIRARCQRAMGNKEDALRLYQKSVEEMRRHRFNSQHRSYPLTAIASLQLELGQVEEALETYDGAIREARRHGFREWLANTLKAKASALDGLGRPKEAIPLLEEAQPLYAALEDEAARGAVTARLASLYHRVGSYQDAVGAWATVRQVARRTGDPPLHLSALEGLAASSREHFGEADVAVPLYEEAAELAVELDDHEAAARILNSLGVLAWNRGELETARSHYERALRASRAAGRSDGSTLILASLGAVHVKCGRPAEAVEALREALASSRESGGSVKLRGYALGVLGDALLQQRDLDGAEEAYSRSLALRRQLGDEHGEGWMLLKLSDVEERRGALDRVRELNGRAYEIASRVGDEELLQASTARERY